MRVTSVKGRRILTMAESTISNPAMELGAKEKAILFVYKAETKKWEQGKVKVRIAQQPFAQGALRYAYHAVLYFPKDSAGIEKTLNCVVKSYKKKQKDEIYFTDVSMQMFARWWAKRYNERNPPKKITFVEAFALRLIKRKGQPVVSAELRIEGQYIKHSDNHGFVNTGIERNTPHAFSHFTFEASQRKLVVVDIQGVGDFYTDPQIHTQDKKGFGLGNLGSEGIKKWMSTHTCSAICEYLQLPAFNKKAGDKGTQRPDRSTTNQSPIKEGTSHNQTSHQNEKSQHQRSSSKEENTQSSSSSYKLSSSDYGHDASSSEMRPHHTSSNVGLTPLAMLVQKYTDNLKASANLKL